jgi:hypothetical protein
VKKIFLSALALCFAALMAYSRYTGRILDDEDGLRQELKALKDKSNI